MSRLWFPPELCLEVASHSSISTIAQLLCSASSFSLATPLLYRHISVGDRAYGLACIFLQRHSPDSSKVKSLEFCGSLCAHLDNSQWAVVLPALRNLRHLEITHHVPLDAAVLPRLTFRLHSFTSACAVFGPWLEFLSQQPELREVAFHSDVLGPVPDTTQLPMLRRVTARPSDLASSPARLVALRVNATQFLVLLHMAPIILGALEHLILEEDRTWEAFHAQSKGTLPAVAAGLDTRTPHMKTLTLVCSRRLRARQRGHHRVEMCHLARLGPAERALARWSHATENIYILASTRFCFARLMNQTSAQHASQILTATQAPAACAGCAAVPADYYHCRECANVQCGHCIMRIMRSIRYIKQSFSHDNAFRHPFHGAPQLGAHSKTSALTEATSSAHLYASETPPRRAPSPDPARQRRRSLPLAKEVRERHEQYINSGGETGWQDMCSELAAWGKANTQLMTTEAAVPEENTTGVQHRDAQAHERVRYNIVWAHDDASAALQPHEMPAGMRQDFLSDFHAEGYTDGENPENGWAPWVDAPPVTVAEAAEADIYAQNVRRLIMDRMPEPRRRDMLRDEYCQDLLDQQDARARRERDEAALADWSTLAGEYID
ncbi:hypothetical protein C8R44DRAFT_736580 [Mycena epipterygia]|nr:hypothetical protein C8R44DRAFT_736580 [Mycena epipterygia]